MPSNGAGSQRIVVIGEDAAPRAAPAPQPQPHEMHPSGQDGPKSHVMQRGWTTRRLTIAGALGAGATVLGGVLFLSKFGVLGGNDSPVLAMGFGLFVIGMVVFCAALVALLGLGIGGIAYRHGWPRAAGIIFGPLALAWGLYGLGVFAYAVPAVLSLVLIAGLVVALK